MPTPLPTAPKAWTIFSASPIPPRRDEPGATIGPPATSRPSRRRGSVGGSCRVPSVAGGEQAARPKARSVTTLTMPSTTSPWSPWNSRTAASVFGPKSPPGVMPRARWAAPIGAAIAASQHARDGGRPLAALRRDPVPDLRGIGAAVAAAVIDRLLGFPSRRRREWPRGGRGSALTKRTNMSICPSSSGPSTSSTKRLHVGMSQRARQWKPMIWNGPQDAALGRGRRIERRGTLGYWPHAPALVLAASPSGCHDRREEMSGWLASKRRPLCFENQCASSRIGGTCLLPSSQKFSPDDSMAETAMRLKRRRAKSAGASTIVGQIEHGDFLGYRPGPARADVRAAGSAAAPHITDAEVASMATAANAAPPKRNHGTCTVDIRQLEAEQIAPQPRPSHIVRTPQAVAALRSERPVERPE